MMVFEDYHKLSCGDVRFNPTNGSDCVQYFLCRNETRTQSFWTNRRWNVESADPGRSERTGSSRFWALLWPYLLAVTTISRQGDARGVGGTFQNCRYNASSVKYGSLGRTRKSYHELPLRGSSVTQKFPVDRLFPSPARSRAIGETVLSLRSAICGLGFVDLPTNFNGSCRLDCLLALR
jgi:hypothetical protein